MMAKNFVFLLLLLYVQYYSCQDIINNDISLNYEFDYQTEVEWKNSSNEYETLLSYNGKIETSSYYMTDKQELLLLKLKIYGTGSSITSIVIRKDGLAEKIIIDDSTSIGMVNLLKGTVNMFSIHDTKENKTELDVSGECTVTYNSINDNLLLKEKTNCNKTIVSSYIEKDLDTFSVYSSSNIKTYYSYKEGAILSITTVETHSMEPVLFQTLSQEYKSTTTIKFAKLTKSRTLIGNASLSDVIRLTLGSNYREVFLLSIPEVLQFKGKDNQKVLSQIQSLIKNRSRISRSNMTLNFVNHFRSLTNESLLIALMKKQTSNELKGIIIDSAVSCGTKICSDFILKEFGKYSRLNLSEANRILILLQNVRIPNDYIISKLWPKIKKLSGDLYHQAIQTICSLIYVSRDSQNIQSIINEIIEFIKYKLLSCENNQCFSQHFSAIKNSRNQAFYDILQKFVTHSGNYSSNAVANALNAIWILKYNSDNESVVKEKVFRLVKTKIIFFEPHVQYHSIQCLVMLQIDTDKLVDILDHIRLNNSHYQYFLIKKLSELINLGVIKDPHLLLESKFFRYSKHFFITYPENDGSKMIIKPLFSTDNSLMDIHFNMIGSESGIIKHTNTDLFLVSTATENNVFSLSSHMSGLESILGSSDDTNEKVEGEIQIALFGKLSKPITLFRSTAELMSMFWNAPSELESIFQGTFLPIDIQNEIHFQNGMVMSNNFLGSVFLDFSFQLTTSLWYKTADSLFRSTGSVYTKMDSKIKSMDKSANNQKEISLKTGIDFTTNIQFMDSPIKSCLSIARHPSKLLFKSNTLIEEYQIEIDKISEFSKISGVTYSITKKMDQLCGTF